MRSLGTALGYRFVELGMTEDMQQFLCITTAALDLTPDDQPALKVLQLRSSGDFFRWRFAKCGDTNDINEAVLRNEAAVTLMPDNEPDKFLLLDSLAKSLFLRSEHLGTLSDMNQAIAASR
ncbi:hypothetical protein FB45DRAFT_756033 [Roridomyces roridus]|uniref:Uncharacterized protein n=1 Tax=Roridomyces roridus TaxID=1738132 RepID=A0AAD7FHA7_9AGAR|nr:hypothetical protein FB45DRAFT_756033 [Roridomyces roridus]